ncbi:hypothetical protein EBR77_04280, partial [bacterium]|nr:hypothetical protein [bacterium]
MKNTLLFSIFSMISLHGVEIIQKEDSNQANIAISMKEIFADTKNDLYYYELECTNQSDIPAYCDISKLSLANPDTESFALLKDKYNDLIKEYKDQYYAWYNVINGAIISSTALCGYMAYTNKKNDSEARVAIAFGALGLLYNIAMLTSDRSCWIDLSDRINAEMNVSKKTITLEYRTELNRVQKPFGKNNDFEYTTSEKAYLKEINGYNRILVCTNQKLETVYYSIIPQKVPEYSG